MNSITQTRPTGKAVVVSSVFGEADLSRKIGLEAYSYPFVARAFLPLLENWGPTTFVAQAESRLDHALHQARRRGLDPVHLSFMPLHQAYLTGQAPTIAFPFWEFPDLPDLCNGQSLRNDWAHVANHLDGLITACHFTREAFERAGVRTPVHVVPVPIREIYFDTLPWEPGQAHTLDAPAYVFPVPEAEPVPGDDPWSDPREPLKVRVKKNLHAFFQGSVRPRLPRLVDVGLVVAGRIAQQYLRAYRHETVIQHPAQRPVELSGVVYSTILNPFDRRKNLEDLLSAFLLALGDCADATLVVKLVLPPKFKVPEFNRILAHTHGLGVTHRCRIVFLPDYLSDAQMLALTRASTYYVSASRAEGACLPLQDALAAGRPGIAPVHTAFADYFDYRVGFVVASHSEPTWWPLDPEKRLTTSWHRVVWQSLFEQFRTSYQVAKQDGAHYRALAEAGRARMRGHAAVEHVRPLLYEALERLTGGRSTRMPRTLVPAARSGAA
jgi:glycosyltransferase involved in cell wall biosynthesis